MIVSGYRGALRLDYGFFQAGAGTSLAGISDGTAGVGPVVEADLATAGLVNSYFPPSGASGLSYYQDFSGAGSIPGGFEDLQGLAITLLDLDSNAGGRYIIF